MPAARDSFRYGPDGMRYFKKSEWAVTSGGTTTMKTSRKYYAGAYEKTVTVGGDTVERTRIGDAVVHVRTTPAGIMPTATSAFEYAHRDHLGSVEAVTDQAGNELIVLGHDPYGERRKNDWTGQLTDIEALLSAHGERVSRGFTRHEHLDRTGLIHMNGRVYDPRLGRFLSPDPIVGDPASSQSWNLYSYVGNNPLSYVDPTGMYPECDWVCEDDMDAWWDWFDFLNSWWNIPHDGSDYYDGASDPYSASDYVSTRSKAENTLRAMDQSVADEPADSGILAALGELIAGWWRGLLERKYEEMKTDCERIHGVGGCDGTIIKDLAPVFGEATGQLGAAGVGKVVAGAASRTTIPAGASAAHATKTANNAGDDAANWIWSQNKGAAKSIRQMDNRGWTPAQVTEAIRSGKQFPAINRVNQGNPAIRYVHPQTGQSVVRDTVTKEIIHFGGPGFRY